MSVAYGIDVLLSNDPYASLAHEAAKPLSNARMPGKYVVVKFAFYFEICAVLSWFPGVGFKRDAQK
ncbi:hypothetical protein K438DRAFT_1612903 [Mycena galopus ATCC 62051]|nr:hypothetical protein K438DRAFT_1612903 [Mycena galopus ATCC 62051]